MTPVDDLWYLSEEARDQAERTYHNLSERYDGYIDFEMTKGVSRERFRTLARRIRENGAPYGAHTIACNQSGALLLVRHEQVGLWVLPGGETDGEETFREAAKRELREEAGIDVSYRGLGMLGRITVVSGDYSTLGVLPLFEAKGSGEPHVEDPDGEITDAQWFQDLPTDTRDRYYLETWRKRRLAPDGTVPEDW